jgi:hypothetical protein
MNKKLVDAVLRTVAGTLLSQVPDGFNIDIKPIKQCIMGERKLTTSNIPQMITPTREERKMVVEFVGDQSYRNKELH